MIMNEQTWNFVRQHRNDDVRKLALQGTKDGDVDLPMALQQIAGWQTARRKLPSWAAIEGIVYPPHLNMEQCSSEQTARYKAQIVSGLTANGQSLNARFVDLTGGFGVDFYWMSQGFKERIYVEQNESLCAISSNNFHLLGLDANVNCGSAADILPTLEHADVIFLDPARRNEHGGRTYGIDDCTPNVLELLPILVKKADFIVLKLSPMLDWRKAVEDIQKQAAHVSEVHIVSVDNECKELLLVISTTQSQDLRLCCVNNERCIEFVSVQGKLFSWAGNKNSLGREQSASNHLVSDMSYLYEPNASIMKAGCFTDVEQAFGVQQISANSHLFLSSEEMMDFPGRGFEILSISSMNKHELGLQLKSITQANISVRNFPLSAEQLRKKLKLKDGGEVYIFATTVQDGQHKLFICRKIS